MPCLLIHQLDGVRWKELYGGGILTISHIGVFVILSHRGFDGRHSTNNLNMIMFHWETYQVETAGASTAIATDDDLDQAVSRRSQLLGIFQLLTACLKLLGHPTLIAAASAGIGSSLCCLVLPHLLCNTS
ncbi:hypothetical protein KC357_g29 [Hortaea werneckii]|nr:hypothetical protein KC357_g29 [Hortaea werneckii]